MTAKNSYLTPDGFGDWKSANEGFVEHEQSKDHLDALITLLHRSKELGRIDSELALQTQERLNYWRILLKRVIHVVKYLCAHGLLLRGDNET